MFTWIGLILTSFIFGIIITVLTQCYFLHRYFFSENPSCIPPLPLPPFALPPELLSDLQSTGGTMANDDCVPMNVLFQFLFHELRDTEKVRRWFRNKLAVEFEELLNRSAIGRMFSSIKVRDISLGSEFPLIKSFAVDDVKVNQKFSHIDSLDLKLDLNYSGGFRIIVDANMMLGKTALLSIKVGTLEGQGRLQFTRLPYSHWSFSFYNDPKLQMDIESQFQGRPMPQITALISSQIRKAIRKKHTLPNYKLRYKPFFTIADEQLLVEDVPSCRLKLHLKQLSRLHHSTPSSVFCLLGIDSLPWIDIVTYGQTKYILLDVTVTKRHGVPLGISCKQELRCDSKKSVVVVETSCQPELLVGDVILAVDGRRVSQVGQVPKLMRGSAVQATVRVERKVYDQEAAECGVPESPTCDGDSSGSSVSGSPARKKQSSERRKPRRSLIDKLVEHPSSLFDSPRIYTTKIAKNEQIVIIEEEVSLSVKSSDRYLNISVHGVDSNQTPVLVAYLNMSLSKIIRSSDFLHCCQMKPPDSFTASDSKTHPLASQNGFIPVLSYGDIIFTAEPVECKETKTDFLSEGKQCDPVVLSSPSKQHHFQRTHLLSSTQCQFCGKKIWFKDAEKCQKCEMTCHKKCVAKCSSGTACSGVKEVGKSFGGHRLSSRWKYGFRDSDRKEPAENSGNKDNPQIVTTQVTTASRSSKIASSVIGQSGARKGLSGLLATVASAGKGLKRAGSAHNLQLPDEAASGDGFSRSLPPSPQQTPGPSRKPSLSFELNEEITALLQSLLQQGNDQGELMCIAKATGKTLYEELDLPQRKEKIQEMMSKLQAAIDNETDLRSSLEKQLSTDVASDTKAAFLIGKSDEKTQALAVLMLHFCAGLQHIQDLEEQDKDSEDGEEFDIL